MKAFIKQVLSEQDGSGSSKRVVLFILLFVFIAEIIINLSTGKQLTPLLHNDLITLTQITLGTVFGEKIVNVFNKNNENNSNNSSNNNPPQ
jgi:hypothetical protein